MLVAHVFNRKFWISRFAYTHEHYDVLSSISLTKTTTLATFKFVEFSLFFLSFLILTGGRTGPTNSPKYWVYLPEPKRSSYSNRFHRPFAVLLLNLLTLTVRSPRGETGSAINIAFGLTYLAHNLRLTAATYFDQASLSFVLLVSDFRWSMIWTQVLA